MDVVDKVIDVINGKLNIYKDSKSNPHDLIEILSKIEGKQIDISINDINGWEADVWYDIIFRGKKCTIEGSGYNGGVKFFLSDEEEED